MATVQEPATGTGLDLAAVGELSQQIVRLTRASHALRAQMVTRGTEGVEWASYLLLVHLVREGPRRSSALAEAACVDPSTVSRQVAHLVRRGLVERRADPVDGRASLLVATERGHAAHAEMQERRLRAFAQMVADWPPDDVRTLTRLLDRLNDSLTAHRTHLLDAMTGDGTRTEETR